MYALLAAAIVLVALSVAAFARYEKGGEMMASSDMMSHCAKMMSDMDCSSMHSDGGSMMDAEMSPEEHASHHS